MKNKSNVLIIAIIAIVAITGISLYALSRNDHGMMHDNESKMFADVTGEDYDRLFIANMIVHHQAAVDMANLALTSAKHQEVKDLATAIVSAQTKEISDMTAWQKSWGYPSNSGESMMDHGAGMMGDLNGKTGDEFDKVFLAQMIIHHQSAIDMASTGATNAYHQELKDLTKAIIAAQTKEILQMRQWQKDWF